jgi:hypothetical protein
MIKLVNHIRLLTIICVIVLSHPDIFSQSEEEIISQIEAQYYEKLDIYTDRDLYITGEKLWISYFLRSMPDGKLPGISSVIYVELINYKNAPQLLNKFILSEGKGSGSLQLPIDLETGQYLLRIYTNRMKEFGSRYFYYKKLYIINPFEDYLTSIGRKTNNTTGDLHIFPEGNIIIPGHKNLLILQTTNENDAGTSEWIYILENDLIIDSIKTDCQGWAMLNHYFTDSIPITLQRKNHPEQNYSLSAYIKNGIQLHLENENKDELYFKIRSQNLLPVTNLSLALIKDRTILNIRPINPGISSVICLQKINLTPGIYRLGIVNKQNEFIADRYFSIEESHSDRVKMQINKKSYLQREKVSLEVNADAGLGHLSMKVVNSALIDSENKINKLPLQVKKLAFYNPSGKLEINQWLVSAKGEEKLIPNTYEINSDLKFPVEIDASVIQGNALNLKTGEYLANTDLWLTIIGEKNSVQLVKTDSSGNFICQIDAQGTGDVIIQPNDTSIGYEINLQDDFFNDYLEWYAEPVNFSEDELDAINQAVINMQLENAFGEESAIGEKAYFDSVYFYGPPDNNIIIDEYIDLPVMEEIIREIVPYVYFRKRKQDYYLLMSDKNTNYLYDDEPLVLVDGVPVFNTNAVMAMDPAELLRIEILQKRYFLHNLKFDGIIHFITRERNFSILEQHPGIFRQTRAFPETAEVFTAPVYDSNRDRDDRRPDYRNTLYWNPHIKLDKGGYAKIEFYTGDHTGNYLIILEGTDELGGKVFLKEEINVN